MLSKTRLNITIAVNPNVFASCSEVRPQRTPDPFALQRPDKASLAGCNASPEPSHPSAAAGNRPNDVDVVLGLEL